MHPYIHHHMQTRAMITEDDLLCRMMLHDLLEDYFPDINVVKMTGNVRDSVEFITDHKIDLLFLDIELPDGKGFDILQSLQQKDFKVIITTSHEKYIQEAGSFPILCLIVKPVMFESLAKAMKRFEAETWEPPVY